MKLATLLAIVATIIMALAGLVATVPINDPKPISPDNDDPELSVDKVDAGDGVDSTTSCSYNTSIINRRNSPEGQECVLPMVAKCCKHNMGEYHKYCRDGKYQPSSTCPSPSTAVDEMRV
jgi:hypothetical protein